MNLYVLQKITNEYTAANVTLTDVLIKYQLINCTDIICRGVYQSLIIGIETLKLFKCQFLNLATVTFTCLFTKDLLNTNK